MTIYFINKIKSLNVNQLNKENRRIKFNLVEIDRPLFIFKYKQRFIKFFFIFKIGN